MAGVLADLGLSQVFDDSDVSELYFRIGTIIGSWHAEQASMDAGSVADALRKTGQNLLKASQSLSGLAEGLGSQVEIGATSHLVRILALHPGIASEDEAAALLALFRLQAEQIGHACMVAGADLDRPLGRRRAVLDWYDDFTMLLMETADAGGIKPNLNKNRTDHSRGGWLFRAAWVLETFLDPRMLSPSEEACGKRLERAMQRLSKPKRTKALPS